MIMTVFDRADAVAGFLAVGAKTASFARDDAIAEPIIPIIEAITIVPMITYNNIFGLDSDILYIFTKYINSKNIDYFPIA
jgi:hypothetical protein